MKNFVLLLALATTLIIANVKSDDETTRVELLNPGFRILVKHSAEYKGVAIYGGIWHGPVPEVIEQMANEIYTGTCTKQDDDWWAFENRTATANPGDTFVFGIYHILDNAQNGDKHIDYTKLTGEQLPDEQVRLTV